MSFALSDDSSAAEEERESDIAKSRRSRERVGEREKGR